jgi:8-oxo-dGTP diphosphatase
MTANPKLERMQTTVGILARGPWAVEDVEAHWHEERFEAAPDKVRAADDAIRELAQRGSPSHDGVAGRLAGFGETASGGLRIELQPTRWALRLVEGDASDSIAALCVARDHEGRWLAGRRAPWLASWPGRWALGAGGAVDLGESPVETLTRELHEEWSVTPERVRAEALVRLPHQLVMFVGMAWLPAGAEVEPDHEHDEYAWWPADVAAWPQEASEPLRRMASLLAA